MKRILILCLAVAILTGLADAKETFYSGLKSKAEVEKESGQVLGTAKFADADWDKEFLAVESTDVVAFPVEKQFTKLEGRRVELFIKMGLDVKDIRGELFLVRLQARHRRHFSTIRWSARRRHHWYEGQEYEQLA